MADDLGSDKKPENPDLNEGQKKDAKITNIVSASMERLKRSYELTVGARKARKRIKDLERRINERRRVQRRLNYNVQDLDFFKYLDDYLVLLDGADIPPEVKDNLIRNFKALYLKAKTTIEDMETRRVNESTLYREIANSFKTKYKKAVDDYEKLFLDRIMLSFQDPLVQLNNRLRFIEQCKMNFAQAKPGDIYLFGIVDVKKFKQINDSYGHPYGDEVLKGIADIIKTNIRTFDGSGDIRARLAGDEFAFCLSFDENRGGPPDLDEELMKSVFAISERFQLAIKCHDWTRIHPDIPSVEVNVGIVVLIFDSNPSKNRRVDEIYAQAYKTADELMYKNKKSSDTQVSLVHV